MKIERIGAKAPKKSSQKVPRLNLQEWKNGVESILKGFCKFSQKAEKMSYHLEEPQVGTPRVLAQEPKRSTL